MASIGTLLDSSKIHQSQAFYKFLKVISGFLNGYNRFPMGFRNLH